MGNSFPQPKPRSGEHAHSTELKDSDLSFEGQDEVIEVSDRLSLFLSPSYSDQDQDRASSFYHLVVTDLSAANPPVITDNPAVTEINLILEGNITLSLRKADKDVC